MSPAGLHLPPPGYAVRAPRRDDAEAVAELNRSIDLARHGDSDSTVAEIIEEWSLPRLDPLRDLWLVTASDGAAVGYGFVYQEHPPDMFAAGHSIHPHHEGRGIEEFLLDVTEARCTTVAAAATPPATALLDTFAHESEQLRLDLFERRGYERVRSFARLQVSLHDAPPEPAWPEGIVVRTFRRGRDEAAVHAAMQEAFLDHWHPDVTDLDEWKTLRFGRPDLDPGLWWVAWDGADVAGGLLAIPTPLGGYIDELAVCRGWRGRGLGRALLLQSFAELRRRGLPVAYLGVDTLNPTGAMHLYGSVGMRPVRGEHLVYEKRLPAS
jgi:ribosomal protein S18 acetylase RimI-like enzyme